MFHYYAMMLFRCLMIFGCMLLTYSPPLSFLCHADFIIRLFFRYFRFSFSFLRLADFRYASAAFSGLRCFR